MTSNVKHNENYVFAVPSPSTSLVLTCIILSRSFEDPCLATTEAKYSDQAPIPANLTLPWKFSESLSLPRAFHLPLTPLPELVPNSSRRPVRKYLGLNLFFHQYSILLPPCLDGLKG